MKNSTENQNKTSKKTTKSIKTNSTKKQTAVRESDSPITWAKIMEKLLDNMVLLQDDVQRSLPKGHYIRATHIVAAPVEYVCESACHQNTDNSHDLHIFIRKEVFAALKCALGKDKDAKVITFNRCPNLWAEFLAA
jgi:hypothetical protein